MKVIGAGFGRTGTLSLKAALEELGYGACYHMTEVFDKPDHAAQWEAAYRGEQIDWDRLFAGYQATVDWPGAAFSQQLIEAYPDAKVLLSVRDPERWYESVRNTIYPASKGALTASPPVAPPGVVDARRMIETIIWQGTFGGRFEDKQWAIAVFEQHNREVVQRVAPNRLLTYDVKEGWPALCGFLGVPVPPDKPFPHLNDTLTFQQRRQSASSDSPRVDQNGGT